MQTTGNLGLKKPEGTDLVDIADLNGNMDILDTAVNGKVDKITGKQLSTNDYTAAEKTKLAGIATGANNYTHPNHTGDVTSTGDGVTAIAAGVIVNADVNATAGIDATKIGTGTVTNAEFGYLDGVTSAIQTQIDAKTGIVDYIRQPAYAATAGTLSAYTVTLTPAPASIGEGFGITIVPNVTNGSSPTLNVNGLGAVALKDQKGLAYAAGKLLAGKPYMFRKVGTDFLADSSGGAGDALAGDIRAGKKAATDAGDIVGTLAVQTGGTVTPTASNIVKPAGIYDTAITVAGVTVPAAKVLNDTTIAGVTGTMVKKTGVNTAPSLVSDGVGKIYVRLDEAFYQAGSEATITDTDFVAANFRADKNIFGIQGNVPVYSSAHTVGVQNTVWSGDRFFIMPPYGMYDGSTTWVTAATPGLTEANVRNGVTIGSLMGNLIPWRIATATVVSQEWIDILGPYNMESTPYLTLNIAAVGFTPRIIIARMANGSGGTVCSDVSFANDGTYSHNAMKFGNGGGGNGFRVTFNSTSMIIPAPTNSGYTYNVTFYG